MDRSYGKWHRLLACPRWRHPIDRIGRFLLLPRSARISPWSAARTDFSTHSRFKAANYGGRTRSATLSLSLRLLGVVWFAFRQEEHRRSTLPPARWSGG